MLQRAKEHLQWLSTRNMPHAELRDDFNWVKPYVTCVELVERIEMLGSERDQVLQLPRALSDVKKDFENSLEMLETHKIRGFEQFILHFTGSPDICGQLRHIQIQDWLRVPSISSEIRVAAFENLKKSWPDQSITDSDRKKKLAEIEKKILGLKKELLKYPDLPKWAEFMDHWSSLQSRCDGAINPQGFEIQNSRPEEVEAFKKLGLGKLVSENNRFHPARSV